MAAQSGWVGSNRFLRGLRLAVAAMLGVAAATVVAQVAVTDGGSPAYSMPIPVPPGVAGMTPKLSLVYSGGATNGPVGAGWSIQGLSTITRCPASVVIDGATNRKSVEFASGDKLCLDGQRLIQTSASGEPKPFPQSDDSQGLAAGAEREFRTEKDSYARVRAYGTASEVINAGAPADPSTGPAYFKVWTKAGLVYEYGAVDPTHQATSRALITARTVTVGAGPTTTKTVAAVWAVRRITDTLGNAIDFKYEQRDIAWGSSPFAASGLMPGLSAKAASMIGSEQTLGHEWNVEEIGYAGARVAFRYEVDSEGKDVRPDRAEAYHRGAKNVNLRRLKSITTYAGAVPVTTLRLSYDPGPLTKRSRVDQVQQCAGGTDSTRCLPPTRFNYTAGANPALEPASTFAGGALAKERLSSLDGKYGVMVADFNGDGLTDILRWSETPSENKLWFSKGDGSFEEILQFNLKSDALFLSNGCYASFAVDVNGDGIADLVRLPSIQTANFQSCAVPMQADFFVNDGAGGFTRRTATNANGGTPIPVYRTISKRLEQKFCGAVQLTSGDGKLPGSGGQATAGGETEANANPCKEIESRYGYGWTAGSSAYFIDFDGDGLLDLITSTLDPLYPVDPWPLLESEPPFISTCAGCTRVYKGRPDGSFDEITNAMANVSLYSDPGHGWDMQSLRRVADVDGDGLADLSAAGNPWYFPAWRSNGDGTFTVVQNTVQDCKLQLDFNGDGRADCLYARAPKELPKLAYPSSLAVADGSGMFTAVAGFNLQNTSLRSDPGAFGSNYGISFVDVNADGRHDILRWHDDANQNILYLSNGDGTFTTSGAYAGVALKRGDGKLDFIAGDFTGRGMTEFLRVATDAPNAQDNNGSNQLLLSPAVLPPDLLETVTSGTGAITTLSYVSIANSAKSGEPRYQSDRFSGIVNEAGVLDLSLPMWVVRSTRTDNGLGLAGSSANVVEYGYAGLKADIKGRGMLGFREVRRQTPTPAGSVMSTVTQYLQKHPYIGAASKTETRHGALYDNSAPVLSRTTNTYCDKSAAPGARAQALTDGLPCTALGKIQRPYLLKTVEQGKDLEGVELPTVTTVNAYERPGNETSIQGDPSSITVTTTGTSAGKAQTSIKVTNNTYLADDTGCDGQTCRWVLGRLARATVTSTVDNLIDDMVAGHGNSEHATKTSGTLNITPKPNLRVSGLVIGTITPNASGGWAIPVSFTVTNTSGTVTAAPSWKDMVYLSSTPLLDDAAASLGSVNDRTTPLAPDASYVVTGTVNTGTSTAPGGHFVHVKADGRSAGLGGTNTDGGALGETNETDNTAVAAVELIANAPDLVLSPLTIGKISANADGSYNIPVTYSVVNSGQVAASGTWHDIGYLSVDAVLDNGDKSVGVLNTRNKLQPVGYSYTVTKTYKTAPNTEPGNYTFFVKTDGRNADSNGTNTDKGVIAEMNEGNNLRSVSVTLAGVDLAVSPPIVGEPVFNPNGSYTFPVTYFVTNVGGRTAKAPWYEVGYLSADAVLDNNDPSIGVLNTRTTDLAPGQTYSVNTSYTTGPATASADYTFFVKVDGRNAGTGGANTDAGQVAEADEANNLSSAVLTLSNGPSTGVDLKISGLTVNSVTAISGGQYRLNLSYTVTNNGTVAATGVWRDHAYLSSDGLLDKNDISASTALNERATALNPGQSYTVTTNFTPNAFTKSGSFSVFVRTDAVAGDPVNKGVLTEPYKANNVARAEVQLNADLAISNVTLGVPQLGLQGRYTIPVTYTVTNVGTSLAGGWFDQAFLSSDESLDNLDVGSPGSYLYAYPATPVLGPGQSYTKTVSITPNVSPVSGDYLLYVKTDSRSGGLGGTATDAGNISEPDELNNVIALPVRFDADLKISNVVVGTITAESDRSFRIPVSFTVTNTGTSASLAGGWFDLAFLSANGVLEDADPSLNQTNSRSAELLPGGSYTVSMNYTTMGNTAAGAYTLFVKTDAQNVRNVGGGTNTDNGRMVEVDETNNVLGVPVSLEADLRISGLTLGTPTRHWSGAWQIPVTYTVTNAGTIATAARWDIGYLSADAVLDDADQSNSYISSQTSMLPQTSRVVTGTYMTTATTPGGTYTLFVKVDGQNSFTGGGTNTSNGALSETNEGNNLAGATVTLSEVATGAKPFGVAFVSDDGVKATWRITNPSTVPVTLSGLATTDPAASVFSTTCAVGSLVAAGATCTVVTNNGASCSGALPYYLSATNAAGTATASTSAKTGATSCVTPPGRGASLSPPGERWQGHDAARRGPATRFSAAGNRRAA